MNNPVFGKTTENMKKHRGIKLAITEKRKNYLVSEPNCHSARLITENLLTIEMRKTQTFINEPVFLGLLILELNENVRNFKKQLTYFF